MKQIKLRYKKIVLAGFGPYFFSTHLELLRQLNIDISIVFELESQFDRTRDILVATGFQRTKIIMIPDGIKDKLKLPTEIKEKILANLSPIEDALFMICTEPQGHGMWLNLAMETELDCYIEKPIIALKNASKNPSSAKLTHSFFLEILQKQSQRSKGKVYLALDRPYSRMGDEIFSWINKCRIRGQFLSRVSIAYDLGSAFTCHEYLTKPNHPHQYGYGVLYHSGLHLIDMLARVIESGFYENSGIPLSLTLVCDTKMPLNSFEEHMGEVDFSALISINQGKKTLKTRLHLSTEGFSRREDFKTTLRNYYAETKRVRSEHYELHMDQTDKLTYQGINSKGLVPEERKEQIEIYSSHPARDFDYKKIDLLEQEGAPNQLYRILALDTEKVCVLEDTVLSHWLLYVFSLAATEPMKKMEFEFK